MRRSIAIILTLAGLLLAGRSSAADTNVMPGVVFTNVQDYGFMWWSNGPASSSYGIKTSRYAMLFNWTTLTPTALFPVTNPRPEAEVLTESWAASFPPTPPVTFTGVTTYRYPVVEERVDADWVPINQAVNGNDFWQADYNSASLTWDITLNLKLGSTNYQDIPALLTNAVIRTFRFGNPNAVTQNLVTPVLFTNAVWLASGGGGAGFQLSGTGPAGQSWRLFATTNLMLPSAQWTLETTGAFSVSGQFNYTNSLPTSGGQRFYQLISP